MNINTAPEAVLAALGLDEDMARKVILYRAGKDGQEGTLDDNAFISASDIVSSLAQAYPLSGQQVEQLNRVAAQSLGVGSNNFSIKCTARISANYSLTVESVVKRDGKILYRLET